jgi:hypothetical protein
MKHRVNCKCPGCDGRRWLQAYTPIMVITPLSEALAVKIIRRLLRERATLYRVMADMTDRCRPYEGWMVRDTDRRLRAEREAMGIVARERGMAK